LTTTHKLVRRGLAQNDEEWDNSIACNTLIDTNTAEELKALVRSAFESQLGIDQLGLLRWDGPIGHID
jgi:hypothetical protein